MNNLQCPKWKVLDCAKEQEDEFSVLSSIYYDSNIQDLRKPSAWKVSRPLDVQISLKPLDSESATEAFVGIDLRVICTSDYPNVAPEIVLCNVIGLNDSLVKDLKNELIELANNSLGEVMIHNLCNYVRTFLYTHNKRPKRQASCHEEMLMEEERRRLEEKERKNLLYREQKKISSIQQKVNEQELKEKQRAAKNEEKEEYFNRQGFENSRGASVPPSQKLYGIIDQSDDIERKRSTSESNAMLITQNVQSAFNDNTPDLESLGKGVHSTSSRLHNDFTILEVIGRGGFGEVIKVKNSLDGRLYAIKRIELNPRSRKPQTRRITREVKLLSRLYHENVVRYYNSWIEINDSLPQSLEGSPNRLHHKTSSEYHHSRSNPDEDSKKETKDEHCFSNKSESDSENESDEEQCSNNQDESNSEDITDKDAKTNLIIQDNKEEDDSVIFEKSSLDNNNLNELSKSCTSTDTKKISYKLEFLYIQMEYCEGSTLRKCIDEGLYKNQEQLWRLFREIIDGLAHIHDQGMIHRDLKPVNIFLDSHSRVKIGDFGLATVLAETAQLATDPENSLDVSAPISKDLFMTTEIGTMLYTSPEINSKKTVYNQKVDLYSLGVSFFEMCYPPLMTEMERIEILRAIRQPEINFPDDFDLFASTQQKSILLWLLNHNPDERPTARMLSESKLIPPMELEEQEVDKAFNTAVKNVNSRMHSKLLSIIFSQKIAPSVESLYDFELTKQVTNKSVVENGLSYRSITSVLRRIFERHGAIEMSVPILAPLSQALVEAELGPPIFMDHNGGLVVLPFNSKIHFSRYVEKCNIQNLKRFSFEQIYRRHRVKDLHPKQLTLCSFDIISTVSPKCFNTMLQEAEVIFSVHEIIEQFPFLSDKNYCIRLNHALIVKAILMHNNIAIDMHTEVGCAIADKNLTNLQQLRQIETRLSNLQLKKSCIDNLIKFFSTEDSLSNIASFLCFITKRKQMPAKMIKKGLEELETLISLLKSLECKFEPIISLGLLTNIHTYSGISFRVERLYIKGGNSKSRKLLTLADGGRYDPLLAYFQSQDRVGSKQKLAMGVNIYLDKLITTHRQGLSSLIEVLVCSLNQTTALKVNIAKILWTRRISCSLLEEEDGIDVETAKKVCRRSRINYLIIVNANKEHLLLKIDTMEKDKLVYSGDSTKFLEFLQTKFMPAEILSKDSQEANNAISGRSKSIPNMFDNINSSNSTEQVPTLPHFDMKLVDVKGTYTNPKVVSDLQAVLSNFSSKANVKVLVIQLSKYILKNIVANIETKDEASFNSSTLTILKEFSREKRYLQKVFDDLKSLRFQNKNNPVIIIYSLQDTFYKILM